MDILGIGFYELIFILLIAMIVFGPRRLPEIAAKAGKLARDLRGMSQGLMTEWQREVAVAARLDEAARSELEKTKQTVQDIQEIAVEAKSQLQESIPRLSDSTSSASPVTVSEEMVELEKSIAPPRSPANSTPPVKPGQEMINE